MVWCCDCDIEASTQTGFKCTSDATNGFGDGVGNQQRNAFRWWVSVFSFRFDSYIVIRKVEVVLHHQYMFETLCTFLNQAFLFIYLTTCSKRFVKEGRKHTHMKADFFWLHYEKVRDESEWGFFIEGTIASPVKNAVSPLIVCNCP